MIHNQYNSNELELGRFGTYLLKSRIVAEKYASYYVAWVRRFLSQVPANGGSLEDQISSFVDNLRATAASWQLDQAEKAVRLYFTHYLNHAGTESAITEIKPDAMGFIRKSEVMDAVRRLIRLRHYSCRTEQTYLGWLDRFFRYMASCDAAASGDTVKLPPQSVKDYLAYLAVKERVAGSTQNQAFNALLFVFREVLRIDLGDLSHGIRAKRGMHLPVVLSAEEVKALFANMRGTPRLMAELIYGGGLRVSECCTLRVKDIDLTSNLIFVRSGKGDKDRSTLLAQSIKPALIAHLERVKAHLFISFSCNLFICNRMGNFVLSNVAIHCMK